LHNHVALRTCWMPHVIVIRYHVAVLSILFFLFGVNSVYLSCSVFSALKRNTSWASVGLLLFACRSIILYFCDEYFQLQRARYLLNMHVILHYRLDYPVNPFKLSSNVMWTIEQSHSYKIANNSNKLDIWKYVFRNQKQLWTNGTTCLKMTSIRGVLTVLEGHWKKTKSWDGLLRGLIARHFLLVTSTSSDLVWVNYNQSHRCGLC